MSINRTKMVIDGGGGGKKQTPAKKKAVSKTVVTPGTKVSQATIDKIKAMGMTKALKSAANASPEMREGLKRMYGAKRVAAAGGAASSGGGKYVGSRFVPNTPAARSADAARASVMKPSKPVAKTADEARKANMPYTPATKTKAVNMPYKKPSAVQIAAGKARAGGNSSVYSSSRTAPAKTQAQINAAKSAANARKKAIAAARKAAGGRNI